MKVTIYTHPEFERKFKQYKKSITRWYLTSSIKHHTSSDCEELVKILVTRSKKLDQQISEGK